MDELDPQNNFRRNLVRYDWKIGDYDQVEPGEQSKKAPGCGQGI